MIEWLHGKVGKKLPTGIILNVGGVGYRLDVPLPFLCEIPKTENLELEVWVYTRVKEDALQLYGFKTHQDKECFEMLLSVNKVGPKVALAILSTLDISGIVRAVDQNRSDAFQAIPGIGTNLAGKLVIELRNKVKKQSFYAQALTGASASTLETQFAESPEVQVFEDIRSALENLGFKPKDIESALKGIPEHQHSLEFSKLMKIVLNTLNAPAKTKSTTTVQRELF